MRSRRKITEDFHRKIQIRIQQRRVPARDTRKLTALRITANNVKRRERATRESERKLPERERAAREREKEREIGNSFPQPSSSSSYLRASSSPARTVSVCAHIA